VTTVVRVCEYALDRDRCDYCAPDEYGRCKNQLDDWKGCRELGRAIGDEFIEHCLVRVEIERGGE
jgi:hypothetical protein